MTAKEQLQGLLRIQELAIEIRNAQKIVENAPGRVEEIEGHFRERNAEYVAVKDRFDALEADQKSRSHELTGLEEGKQKYQDDLMKVANQREYAAMLKEIDAVKAQIGEHEEAILRDMEEIEKLTGELATHEEHIVQERESVERDRAEVESEADQARSTIETLSADRREVDASLPVGLLTQIRRLEQTRQGIFLSKADNGTCQSCFVRVRPQVFQEIRMATAVHTCSNCRRFLYFEPALRKAAEPSAAEGVETINGPAV